MDCKKATGLLLRNLAIEDMITNFVLNEILHHVGMSWIISSNDEIQYEIDEIYVTSQHFGEMSGTLPTK